MIQVAPRPARKEPALLEVARFWQRRPDLEQLLPRWPGLSIGLGEPFCGACGWLAPDNRKDYPYSWERASHWLDRAHIITRAQSERGCGLDLPTNVIQLCQVCHKAMPLWDLGDERRAFEWLTLVPRKDAGWQLFTDFFDWTDGGRPDLLRMFNAVRATGPGIRTAPGVTREVR